MASVLTEDPTKVFGRRMGAAVVDGLIIGIPTFALASAQFEYYDAASTAEAEAICDRMNDDAETVCISANQTVYFSEDVGSVSASIGLGLLLALLLHVVLQGLSGWTIGKRLFGIRTVAEDGGRPGIGRALVRWLLWAVVDSQPCGIPLVGLITGLTSTGHRRVGDMVAKTYVVQASAAGAPITVPGLDVPPGPAAPSPIGSSAAPPTGAPAPSPTSGAAHPPPTARPGPQWDEARGTYIQWDPDLKLWMQWDEAAQAWNAIPNQ